MNVFRGSEVVFEDPYSVVITFRLDRCPLGVNVDISKINTGNIEFAHKEALLFEYDIKNLVKCQCKLLKFTKIIMTTRAAAVKIFL